MKTIKNDTNILNSIQKIKNDKKIIIKMVMKKITLVNFKSFYHIYNHIYIKTIIIK